MRLPRAIAALAAAALVVHAPRASAQTDLVLSPCGNIVCGGPLGQFVGQFAFVTGALMPRSAGLGFTVGLAHQYLFSVESSVQVPLTVNALDAVNRGVVELAARARIRRVPLGGPQGPVLDVILRAGVAGVFGTLLVNGAVVGPSFEMTYGAFALVLRASLVVAATPRTAASPPLGVDVLPFLEFGIGAVPPAQR